MNYEKQDQENEAYDDENEVWIYYNPIEIAAMAFVLLIPAILCWFFDMKFVIFITIPLIVYLFFHYGKRYCFSPNGVFVYTLLGYQQRRMSWYQITHLERYSRKMNTYLVVSTLEKPLPNCVIDFTQDYIRANASRLLQIPVKCKFFESDDYKKIVAMMKAAHNE